MAIRFSEYMKKIAIYTSIFGPYDGLLPQPGIPGVDYYCFTDQDFRSSIWNIVKLPIRESSARHESRKSKILPHLFLADYEYSIYMDGNFLLLRNPRQLLESVFLKAPMGIFDHNQSGDARNCVYKEHQAIIDLYNQEGVLKDNLTVIQKQMDRYRKEGYPEQNGLISAGILIRKHNEPEVIRTMETWWNEFTNGSKRDQLSFNYAVWKNNFSPLVIDGDIRNNQYFYFIGKHRKNYAAKFFRYRLKKVLGIIHHPEL